MLWRPLHIFNAHTQWMDERAMWLDGRRLGSPAEANSQSMPILTKTNESGWISHPCISAGINCSNLSRGASLQGAMHNIFLVALLISSLFVSTVAGQSFCKCRKDNGETPDNDITESCCRVYRNSFTTCKLRYSKTHHRCDCDDNSLYNDQTLWKDCCDAAKDTYNCELGWKRSLCKRERRVAVCGLDVLSFATFCRVPESILLFVLVSFLVMVFGAGITSITPSLDLPYTFSFSQRWIIWLSISSIATVLPHNVNVSKSYTYSTSSSKSPQALPYFHATTTYFAIS